jgi:hypothetical protein
VSRRSCDHSCTCASWSGPGAEMGAGCGSRGCARSGSLAIMKGIAALERGRGAGSSRSTGSRAGPTTSGRAYADARDLRRARWAYLNWRYVDAPFEYQRFLLTAAGFREGSP